METNNNDWTEWTTIIRKYSQPNPLRSWWQIANSFIPYFALWVIMVYLHDRSYWITLGLSILAAGFLVRIFIIFHDCGHGSFFKTPLMNRIVGVVAGALVYTPYHRWHYQHMVHHKTVGNLDKRGVGDVLTLTVDEYVNRSKKQRLVYRLYRNPVILFFIVPVLLFTLINKLPNKSLSRKIDLYTYITTLVLAAAVTGISLLIGFKTFILIQLPILYFASMFGVWLFYVQHQYEDVIWEREENWDYKTIAMNGSSYLKLPRLIQWFSGNIGFHHIHHLSPKIPNYYLEKCYRENDIFQNSPITFLSWIKSLNLHLWDEKKRKLVGFKTIQG